MRRIQSSQFTSFCSNSLAVINSGPIVIFVCFCVHAALWFSPHGWNGPVSQIYSIIIILSGLLPSVHNSHMHLFMCEFTFFRVAVSGSKGMCRLQAKCGRMQWLEYSSHYIISYNDQRNCKFFLKENNHYGKYTRVLSFVSVKCRDRLYTYT